KRNFFMNEEQKLQRSKEDMQGRSVVPQTVPPRVAREKSDTASKKPVADPLALKMDIEKVDFYYGRKQALKDISLTVPENEVPAFIGPSGCGKSTLLRSLNRMNDIIPGARVEGRIELDGEDIYAPSTDVVTLRRRIGMVFQKSNPFPRSIFDNVAYG